MIDSDHSKATPFSDVANKLELTTLAPKHFSYEPDADITAFELAQIMPALMLMVQGHNVEHIIADLDPSAARHFKEIKVED